MGILSEVTGIVCIMMFHFRINSSSESKDSYPRRCVFALHKSLLAVHLFVAMASQISEGVLIVRPGELAFPS